MNTHEKPKKKKDEVLPWWVELFFVQIGLPDSLLIKIIKNEKKSLLTLLFVIATYAYFYPVIKQAKNKIDCVTIAKDYIVKNKKIILTKKRELNMLSTNFCYGGEEIYKIKNLSN